MKYKVMTSYFDEEVGERIVSQHLPAQEPDASRTRGYSWPEAVAKYDALMLEQYDVFTEIWIEEFG